METVAPEKVNNKVEPVLSNSKVKKIQTKKALKKKEKMHKRLRSLDFHLFFFLVSILLTKNNF